MNTDEIQLSIIIVSYNTRQRTLDTLTSVFAELNRNMAAEVIVVDNHSTDDSVPAIKKAFGDQVHTIENKENLGFSRANNLGITHSHGKLLFLLNSDTVVQPGSIASMVDTFTKHPINDVTAHLSSHAGELDRLGILAATLLNPDHTPQPQGGSFPSLVTLTVHMLMIDDIPVIGQLFPSTQHTGKRADMRQHTQPYQQDWVGGTAMMIRREVIEEIGLLEENIFMYGEDVEFCMRAKNHHWDVAITPAAKIIHIGNASSTSEHAIIGEFKGYLYIWSKHYPHWQMYFVRLILWWGALLRSIIFGTIVQNKEKAGIYQRVYRRLNAL